MVYRVMLARFRTTSFKLSRNNFVVMAVIISIRVYGQGESSVSVCRISARQQTPSLVPGGIIFGELATLIFTIMESLQP